MNIPADGKIYYSVDKENRTVTAHVRFWPVTLKSFFFKKPISFVPGLGFSKDWLLVRRFSAVAHCHPEDEWDENEGRKIARNKVLQKYYKVKMVYVNKLWEVFIATQKYLMEMSEDTKYRLQAAEEYKL